MPRKKDMGRSANGSGNIRKIIQTVNGKQYTYWQARYTAGYDPGTGKQIQRSITGKTQKEVREKLSQLTVDIDCDTYIAPNKQTLGEWLDVWVETYLGNLKPRTLEIYKSDIRLHIKPALGATRLEALDAPMIQAFYNSLGKPSKSRAKGMSPKTVKGIHGVLHKALNQAVLVGYLRHNPTDACILPRRAKTKIKPLDDVQIADFLRAIQGTRFEMLYTLTLFSGMREGEVLGLTWDCVDFDRGMIFVEKQLQLHQERGLQAYEFIPTKNDQCRSISVAPSVLAQLQRYRAARIAHYLEFGIPWSETGLVFTGETGQHLTKPTIYREFKRVVAEIGRPDARFHDLRHPHVKHTTNNICKSRNSKLPI